MLSRKNSNTSNFRLQPNTDENTLLREHVHVYLRQRAWLPSELQSPEENIQAINISDDGKCIYKTFRSTSSSNSTEEKSFKFTDCFGQSASQVDIYENVAKPLVQSTIDGYSCAIIAYGQTGSGKTYTLRGSISTESEYGIMMRCINELLSCVHENTEIFVSYLQIYCEVVSDLLIPDSTSATPASLVIREGSNRVYVEGLSKHKLSSIDDFHNLLERGDRNRNTASTNFNEFSSRSHAICIITIKKLVSPGGDPNPISIESNLYCVDLAGSERAEANTSRNYMRFEEMKSINLSLSALGNCIHALVEGKSHIGYRDSKLTRLLQNCIGGGSRLSIIATVSPGRDESGEALNTLRFASRASKLIVSAKVSRCVDYEKLYDEIKKQLDQVTIEFNDKDTDVKMKTEMIENQSNVIEALRDKIEELERKIVSLENLNISGSDNNNDSSTGISSQVFEENNQKYERLILGIQQKYDDKLLQYETKYKKAIKDLTETRSDLLLEKKNHLKIVKDFQVLQQKIIEDEKEFGERKQELFNEISDRDIEIEQLLESTKIYELKITELEGKLNEMQVANETMMSLEKVKEMENKFVSIVERLTERVQLLERSKSSESSRSARIEPGRVRSISNNRL